MSAMLPLPDDTTARPTEAPWKEFARAPLVPIAVASTLGLVSDRYLGVPLATGLIASVVALTGWLVTRTTSRRIALGWLLVCVTSLSAVHHHSWRHSFHANDILTFTKDTPQAVRVRGKLADEPVCVRAPRRDPLVSVQRVATSTALLDVTEIDGTNGWQSASGRLRLAVEGWFTDAHCGDTVEVVGRLSRPDGPHNPGERDYRTFLLDRRITAELRVKHSADPVVRLEEGWRTSFFGWLAAVRGWGSRVLQHSLSHESGLATALLLGDSTALEREEWDAYVRTGVIHVLAISGQHLVVLGWFLWLILRLCGVRTRHGAWVVALFLLAYALMTGARPSAIRAAIMVCVVCGGVILRRPVSRANVFAFAWLIVLAANPTDPFTAGCQLSFLSVFVMLWGCSRWLIPRDLTPVEQLIEESRGMPEKMLRASLRVLWKLFAISTLLTVVNAPLVLAWQNVASPIGVLIGPPLIVLTSIALVSGFLLIVVSPIGTFAAWPFARLTEWSLATCEWVVRMGDQVPFGHTYSPAPAIWWLTGFYALVAGTILMTGKPARRYFVGVLVWTVFGLVLSFRPQPTDEARVTFLSVGHGGCVVIESPDGRVFLYDAGTMAGPDTVRRVIAPFLWSRGLDRIDELFLSHADLDHFNNVPQLLNCFTVGRVTMTPTFTDKASPGVSAVLAALEAHGVSRRIVHAGDRFTAGSISFEVLHPPASGPNGNENTRSLVLLIRHAGHTILLTGDLEGEGQRLVIAAPIAPVDVMLAPHHGARSANAPTGSREKPEPGAMAAWARPKLVVSSQRAGSETVHLQVCYGAVGGLVWDTPTAGAVTVRSHSSGLIASAYRTGEVRVIQKRR